MTALGTGSYQPSSAGVTLVKRMPLLARTPPDMLNAGARLVRRTGCAMPVLTRPPDRLRAGMVGADGLEPPTLSV